MRGLIKDLFTTVLCVCVVLAALNYTGMISLSNFFDSFSDDKTHQAESNDPNPEAPLIEEQEMPSIDTDVTPKKDWSASTQSPIVKKAEGNIYPLQRPQGNKLGSSGLLPATPIAVVSSRSNDMISYESCTVAFSLPSKSGNFSCAITAGHCGDPGQKIFSYPYGDSFSSARYLGKVVHTSYLGDNPGSGDWAAVKLNPESIHPRHKTRINLALDTYPRPVGKTVCKRGFTTGFDCGDKGQDGVTARLKVGDSEAMTIMSEANLCALPGDSGAPVFDRDGIIGILSSTSASRQDIAQQKCQSDNIAFYSPIGNVVDEIKKSVPDIDFS